MPDIHFCLDRITGKAIGVTPDALGITEEAEVDTMETPPEDIPDHIWALATGKAVVYRLTLWEVNIVALTQGKGVAVMDIPVDLEGNVFSLGSILCINREFTLEDLYTQIPKLPRAPVDVLATLYNTKDWAVETGDSALIGLRMYLFGASAEEREQLLAACNDSQYADLSREQMERYGAMVRSAPKRKSAPTTICMV